MLRRFVMTGELTKARASAALDDHLALGVVRYPHDGLLGRNWQLQPTCTVYDAAHIALAEALDAVSITCDARLAQVPGAHAAVDVVTR